MRIHLSHIARAGLSLQHTDYEELTQGGHQNISFHHINSRITNFICIEKNKKVNKENNRETVSGPRWEEFHSIT